MTKTELRKQIQHERKLWSAQDFDERSFRICSHIQAQDVYQKASSIHCYLPMLQQREVNLYPLLLHAFREKKQIYTPVITQFDAGEMGVAPLNFSPIQQKGHTEYRFSVGRILKTEPSFDLIIVPALAVDKKGYRLGYGKGFYDRFLARQTAPTLVPIFSNHLFEELPIEAHDLPIQYVITEQIDYSGF